jgi:hypothetical protein
VLVETTAQKFDEEDDEEPDITVNFALCIHSGLCRESFRVVLTLDMMDRYNE